MLISAALCSPDHGVFEQFNHVVKGKLSGSWAGTTFDFDRTYPAFQLTLVEAARKFTIDLYRLKTGGRIRHALFCRPCPVSNLRFPAPPGGTALSATMAQQTTVWGTWGRHICALFPVCSNLPCQQFCPGDVELRASAKYRQVHCNAANFHVMRIAHGDGTCRGSSPHIPRNELKHSVLQRRGTTQCRSVGLSSVMLGLLLCRLGGDNFLLSRFSVPSYNYNVSALCRTLIFKPYILT